MPLISALSSTNLISVASAQDSKLLRFKRRLCGSGLIVNGTAEIRPWRQTELV